MSQNPTPVSEDTESFERIRRVSRIMVWVTTIGGLAVILSIIAFFFDSDFLKQALRSALMPGSRDIPVTFTTATLLAGIAVWMIPVSVYLYCFWLVRGLFLGYARGSIFTENAGWRLTRVGVAVALLAPAGIVARSLGTVILTLNNPEGQRHLSIGISSNSIIAITVGMLLVVIGWIMKEAARIAEDNRQIV